MGGVDGVFTEDFAGAEVDDGDRPHGSARCCPCAGRTHPDLWVSLVTSEVLAVTIREIQAELSSEAAAGWPVVGFGTSIFTRRGSSKRAR